MIRVVSGRRSRDRGGKKNYGDCPCSHGYPQLIRRSHSVTAGLGPAMTRQPKALFLATRAIEGRAANLHDSLDPAFAVGARLALAIIHPEIVLEVAKGTVGAPVVAQRRTASLDRI